MVKGVKMAEPSIVTVANQKGGVGKTTTVVNLASAYAQMGKRVLVVDMDYQANATSLLGAEDRAISTKKTIYRAIVEDLTLKDIRLPTNIEGVDVLAATRDLDLLRDKVVGQPQQFKPFPREFINLTARDVGVMGPNHVLNEIDDTARGIERIHRRLRDVRNFAAENGFAHVIRVHPGDIALIDDDLAAGIVQRREVIAHQTERQRRLAAAGFARDAQRLALFDFERHMIDGIYVFAKPRDIPRGEFIDL